MNAPRTPLLISFLYLLMVSRPEVHAQTIDPGYTLQQTYVTNFYLYKKDYWDLRAMTMDPVTGRIYMSTNGAIVEIATGQTEAQLAVRNMETNHWLYPPGLDLQFYRDSYATETLGAVVGTSLIVGFSEPKTWGFYGMPPGVQSGAGLAFADGMLYATSSYASELQLFHFNPDDPSTVSGVTKLSSDPAYAYDLTYDAISGRFYYHRGIGGADIDYDYQYTEPGSGESTSFHTFNLDVSAGWFSTVSQLANPGLVIDPTGKHAYYHKESLLYQVDVTTGEAGVIGDFSTPGQFGAEGMVFAPSSEGRGYSLYTMAVYGDILFEIGGFQIPELTREQSGAWEDAAGWTGVHGQSQIAPQNGTGELFFMSARIDGGTVTLESTIEIESLRVAGGSLKISGNGNLTTHADAANTATSGSAAEVRVTDEAAVWVHLGSTLVVGGEGPGRLIISDQGTVQVAGMLILKDNGVLGGNSGILRGDVLNQSGLISPGESAGTLTIDGDYTQLADGFTLFQFYGDPGSGLFDQLIITGTATLDGVIQLDFTQFTPLPGSTYSFLQAGKIVDNGLEYQIFGLDPHFIDLNTAAGQFEIIPEPHGWALVLSGLTGLCLQRRRAVPQRGEA